MSASLPKDHMQQLHGNYVFFNIVVHFLCYCSLIYQIYLRKPSILTMLQSNKYQIAWKDNVIRHKILSTPTADTASNNFESVTA